MITLKCRSRLWHYPGPGGWHFITLPVRSARVVKSLLDGKTRGWGSVRVKATIGKTSWNTSIFPDRKSNSFVLPVKAEVRTKEEIGDGDTVGLRLDVMV